MSYALWERAVGRFGRVALPGGVWMYSGATAPTNGTSGTGQGKAGPGSVYYLTTNGRMYRNYGTKASPLWRMSSGMYYDEVLISAADIVSTAAGKLGHAEGQILVAAPGAGYLLQLISAVLIFDYATATYGAGGNVTVNWSGAGGAITGLISAANSFGAGADKLAHFIPLSTAALVPIANAGLNMVAASAFTNPGTAAGVGRVKIAYLVHTTGL